MSSSEFFLGDSRIENPYIGGTGLLTNMKFAHDYFAMGSEIDQFSFKMNGYEALFKGVKTLFADTSEFQIISSVDYFKHVSLDGAVTIEMGTLNPPTTENYTYAFFFMVNHYPQIDDRSSVEAFMDSAKITVKTETEEETSFLPGFVALGTYDGTDDRRGHDFIHATVKMGAFVYTGTSNTDTERLAYFEADYKDTDLAATMHTSYEVYSEKRHMTYLVESRIVFGEESVHSEVRTGIGLGQSVHLGGDHFFCVFLTGTPDELESDYYAEYQVKGDN